MVRQKGQIKVIDILKVQIFRSRFYLESKNGRVGEPFASGQACRQLRPTSSDSSDSRNVWNRLQCEDLDANRRGRFR